MSILYTTPCEVARIFNASTGSKTFFTKDAVNTVVPYNIYNDIDPNVAIDKDMMYVDSEFQGGTNYTISFKSATEYDVLAAASEDERSNDYRTIVIGSGNLNSDFTTNDGILSLSSGWASGPLVEGSKIVISIKVDISDCTAEFYIDLATQMIDLILNRCYVKHASSFNGTAYKNERKLPKQIKLAATFLSAHYLYSDLYPDQYKKYGTQDNIVDRWKGRAEKIVKMYAETQKSKIPKTVGFPPFLDAMGIDTIGPEWSKQKSTFAELKRDAQTENIFEVDYEFSKD